MLRAGPEFIEGTNGGALISLAIFRSAELIEARGARSIPNLFSAICQAGFLLRLKGLTAGARYARSDQCRPRDRAHI